MPEIEPQRYLLAFDFGMKKIGVAVGQLITKTARPLDRIVAKQGIPDWQAIEKVLKIWDIQAFVVGIPYKMDDSEQHTTQAARAFAQSLSQNFALPVYEVDEKLTTASARELTFEEGGYKALQNTDIDCLAAKLILEQWMRSQT